MEPRGGSRIGPLLWTAAIWRDRPETSNAHLVNVSDPVERSIRIARAAVFFQPQIQYMIRLMAADADTHSSRRQIVPYINKRGSGFEPHAICAAGRAGLLCRRGSFFPVSLI